MFHFKPAFRRRISRIFIVISASLNLLIAAPAFAQTVLQGVTEQYAPYTYEKDGRATGIITEIVEAMSAKAGMTIEISLYPWARAYKTALEQPNTLIFSIFRSPEREEQFYWIGPVIPPAQIGLYKLKERADIRLSSLEDAKKYLTSVVRNTIFHTYLLEHGFEEGKHIDLQADPGQNLKLLLFKRVDFVFAEEFENAALLDSLELRPDVMEEALPLPELNADFYVAVSKQTPEETAQKLRAAFEAIQADGTVAAILNKYHLMFQGSK